MAKITDEIKVQINELYYCNHNKSLTARTLGISVASVNKYLIENYVPLSERQVIPQFSKKPQGCQDFVEYALWNKLDEYLVMSEVEKEELKQLQTNEIF